MGGTFILLALKILFQNSAQSFSSHSSGLRSQLFKGTTRLGAGGRIGIMQKGGRSAVLKNFFAEIEKRENGEKEHYLLKCIGVENIGNTCPNS